MIAKNFLIYVIGLTFLFIFNLGIASPLITREPAVNASPLGVEIGFANLEGVRQKIGAQTKLIDNGINAYSHGKMLASDGTGLDVDGLSNITFIFDENNVLQGVLMTLPKKAKEMHASLSKKYKVASNKIDSFMGFGNAKYIKGDSSILLNAEHLSFEMDINYLSNRLLSDFNRQSSADNAANKKKQENKF